MKYNKINCIVLNIIEVRTIILRTIQFLLEVEVIQGMSWCVRGYTTKIHTIIVYSKHHTHTHDAETHTQIKSYLSLVRSLPSPTLPPPSLPAPPFAE